jgi:hypothetical protein
VDLVIDELLDPLRLFLKSRNEIARAVFEEDEKAEGEEDEKDKPEEAPQ